MGPFLHCFYPYNIFFSFSPVGSLLLLDLDYNRILHCLDKVIFDLYWYSLGWRVWYSCSPLLRSPPRRRLSLVPFSPSLPSLPPCFFSIRTSLCIRTWLLTCPIWYWVLNGYLPALSHLTFQGFAYLNIRDVFRPKMALTFCSYWDTPYPPF